jgi:cytochrome bd-type quinol oxidase subunit 2
VQILWQGIRFRRLNNKIVCSIPTCPVSSPAFRALIDKLLPSNYSSPHWECIRDDFNFINILLMLIALHNLHEHPNGFGFAVNDESANFLTIYAVCVVTSSRSKKFLSGGSATPGMTSASGQRHKIQTRLRQFTMPRQALQRTFSVLPSVSYGKVAMSREGAQHSRAYAVRNIFTLITVLACGVIASLFASAER